MKRNLKKIKHCDKYSISSTGKVLRTDGKEMALTVVNGRSYININNKNAYINMRVADLVAKYFLRASAFKKYIIHKDGNLLNDNFNNLEYSYQPEFSKDRRIAFKKYLGKKHWKSRPFKINNKKFHTLREAGEYVGVSCLSVIQKRLLNINMKNYKYC